MKPPFESCVDCKHAEILPDPDPLDWFCSDDVKVYCSEAGKLVTVGCQPYRVRKESTPPPAWCPLRYEIPLDAIPHSE